MKIGILGTRGIPNHYGGFEQFASELAPALVNSGHGVTVYNSHQHPFKGRTWQGAELVHCYDPEHWMGTAGQFIYDLNCLLHARTAGFDVLLLLGYTSSSAWGFLYPKQAVIINNMDGLEWARSKYSQLAKKFLHYAEKLAVRHSHHLVADSPVIKEYLDTKYNVQSTYIPYGAHIPPEATADSLNRFTVTPGNYYMLMARMEKENNIDLILKGYAESGMPDPFIVVGNMDTSYGREILKTYNKVPGIRFAGGIYGQDVLASLVAQARLYFHGHSVGGTNPSLLEAMAAGAMIAAHDNAFNRAVLAGNALYFHNSAAVAGLLRQSIAWDKSHPYIQANLQAVRSKYNWSAIITAYEQLFVKAVGASSGALLPDLQLAAKTVS